MFAVLNIISLPTSDQVVGDTYNLEDSGMNVAWNGTEWDDLGAIIDLTGYVKETDLVEVTNAIVPIILNRSAYSVLLTSLPLQNK